MVQKLRNVKADFAPIRWWEVMDFIRLTLTMVKDRDPFADRILARPWSLFSLLEYGYMLIGFFRSKSFFIQVSGEHAGVIAWEYRPGFIYLYVVGLLPGFQRSNLGLQAGQFFRDHHLNAKYQIVVGAMAVKNRLPHMLMGAFGGRLLGLSTTTLRLTPPRPTPVVDSRIDLKRLSRTEAIQSWRRWRLYEVEQVAGQDVLETATRLLENLPLGKYLALYQGDLEIGIAVTHGHADDLEVDLFPSREFWSSASTANFVAHLTGWLDAPVCRLTVTQTHANTLTASETFSFERNREDERHFFFIKRP